jgi:hypothetical protein
MKITIVVEAKHIPDCTEVRKVTGATKYVLRTKFPVYGLPNGQPAPVTIGEGFRFLVGESGVNAIKDDTKLAVDEELDDAIDFLNCLQDSQRSHK